MGVPRLCTTKVNWSGFMRTLVLRLRPGTHTFPIRLRCAQILNSKRSKFASHDRPLASPTLGQQSFAAHSITKLLYY